MESLTKTGTVQIARTVLQRQMVTQRPVVISCDCHSENTYMFAVDTRTGEIKMDRYITGGVKEVCRMACKQGSASEVVVLYEAGHLGFSLYRRLSEAGYSCHVIAPNSIPRPAGRKTDRQDAIGNFDYYCAGLLRFVWVPDAASESARECLRYRYQLVWERTAEKQKVQALTKRQGLVFTETKKSWTKKHRCWLKTVTVNSETRMVLDMRLDRIDQLDASIARLDTSLQALVKGNERYRRLYAAYRMMTGIGELGALTWILEGHDLNRFGHPANLMGYLGLIPRKNASGGRDPALSITKAGNAYLRYVTVCATRCYTDRRLAQRAVAIEKYPKEVAELVKRCQDRLCARYQHLRQRKKNGNKAKVAIARELCAFIWELGVRVLPLVEDEELRLAA